MSKYIIEGGINFYEELYKSLDNNDTNKEEDKLCQITGLPLVDNFVTLECSHKFNYDSLYKEICKQKYVFRTYTAETLTNSEYQKFKESEKDYFIKCPYCRCIQFTLLPHYPDSPYEAKYGINSLEKTQNDMIFLIKPNTTHNHDFTAYGYTFQQGGCCQTVIGMKDGKPVFCQSKYTSYILEINKSFCVSHIRTQVKQYKMEKKALEKKQLKEEKLAEKQKQIEEKQKKKEQKQIEKDIANEKKQLEKQEKQKKAPIKNTVISQSIQIGEFNETPVVTIVQDKCSIILKSGIKKGQQCGSNIKQNGLCARHFSLLQKQEQPQDNKE
jgi:hypothetical protein